MTKAASGAGWAALRPLVGQAEKPSRYIDHEWGAVLKPDAALRFCMIYPDTYEIGQANQAVRILTNVVNAPPELGAERAYLPAPDLIDGMRAADVPLLSLESCTPVANFDVVGITLSHELVATNVLEVLDLAGIPLRASDRSEGDPIVIAGGPCTANPEPFAPFFDAMTIGEGEEATPELLRRVLAGKRAGLARDAIVRDLVNVAGTYVPSLYEMRGEPLGDGAVARPQVVATDGAPARIRRRIYEGFATSSAWEACIVPFAETVHDRLSVEILRGCARGCRFCQAGMIYRPVRERSADNIVSAVCEGLASTGYDEVSLTSLSTTDHSQIDTILARLNEIYAGQGVRISIPSQRLDSFGVAMAELVAGSKKGGLTFAPEAGSQRLRDVINKQVTEKDLMASVDAAFSAGWRRCKLYFMLGLPTETDEDVIGIARLADAVYRRAREIVPAQQRGNVQVSLSAALFVPKAQTPFQWDGQIAPEEAQRRIDLLRDSVRSRAVSVRWHDPATSFIEAALSRGDRSAADWIEAAWRHGARFDAWSDRFNQAAWDAAAEEVTFDPVACAQTSWAPGTPMPWDHIDAGPSLAFLARERRRADEGQPTPDCTMGECSGCGLCPTFDVENALAGVRGGIVGEGAAVNLSEAGAVDGGATLTAGVAAASAFDAAGAGAEISDDVDADDYGMADGGEVHG